MFRVMGVDPGLQSTGYGVIDAFPGGSCLVEGGVIKTVPTTPLPERLDCIHRELSSVITALSPEVVVVEDLFTNYQHPQTAVLMGHARGVILLAAACASTPVSVYTASMVKRALTGNGRASKDQVAMMVTNLLKLREVPPVDHVTDALALALCHCNAVSRGGY